MSYYINTLLEAANIADIYQLTPDKLLITLTLATCTDDALKQELIKLEATSMQDIQEEVNKWETRMDTAGRMHTKTEGATDTPITRYRCGGPHKQNVCLSLIHI